MPPNTFLCVNIGPDVLGHPSLQEVLHTQSSLTGLAVELTEHARVDSYDSLEPVLDRLRDEGALIALDDAGAGYAGLTHMLHVRPSFIKIDRALIAGIDRNEAKQALVEMMGALGGRLDAWMIAEGVETRAELDTLVRLGVPLVQGFHLARPGPGWPEVDRDAAMHLRSSGRAAATPTLRSLLEDACTTDSTQAARAWLDLDDVDRVVVVDGDTRPVCTVEPGGLMRAMTDLLRFNLDTDLVEAAYRALARDPDVRHEPLPCIDNAGRFVGLVRMENVVKTLAATVETSREP